MKRVIKRGTSFAASLIFLLSIPMVSIAKENDKGNSVSGKSPAQVIETKNDNHGNTIGDASSKGSNAHGNSNGNKSSAFKDKKLSIASKQLDKIEEDINKISAQIDKYLSSTTGSGIEIPSSNTDNSTQPTTGTESQTGSGESNQLPAGDTTSSTTGSTIEVPVQTPSETTTETTTDSSIGTTTETTTDSSIGTATEATTETTTDSSTGTAIEASTETTTENTTESSAGMTTEGGITEDEDEAEEEQAIENEDEEFDENQSGVSFVGKLNALNNRIDAIKVSGSGEEYNIIITRISELKLRIKVELDKLQSVKSNIAQKLQSKLQATEIVPKESIAAPDKTWSIKFNKTLSTDTLKNMNIFVVDKNGDPVAVDISYDDQNKTIQLKASDSFKSGETYTLYVSKDIKAKDNTILKNAAKMQFTIQ